MKPQMNASNTVAIDIFDTISSHEQVVFCNDPATGLQAIIAIHDTTLGPALGGTRMYPYQSWIHALDDVLRLSEGMTYKCAAADLDFGGGKAVIIGDPKTDKTPALFRAFGQYVDALNGRFYTGTDMGTTMDDFVQAMKETPYINGIPEAYGGSGDSSIPTAEGVVNGLKATVYHLDKHTNLADYTYALQGLGKVGSKVATYLLEAGASLYVTDVDDQSIREVVTRGKDGQVTVVEQEDIYVVPADIFIPCAVGGIIHTATVEQFQVRAIVGSANNQLAADHFAQVLQDKGILYAPDYIVNAGGLIQVADELYEPNQERVKLKTKAIYHSLLDIYEQAAMTGQTTVAAANAKCLRYLELQSKRNSFYSHSKRPKWQVRGT